MRRLPTFLLFFFRHAGAVFGRSSPAATTGIDVKSNDAVQAGHTQEESRVHATGSFAADGLLNRLFPVSIGRSSPQTSGAGRWVKHEREREVEREKMKWGELNRQTEKY